MPRGGLKTGIVWLSILLASLTGLSPALGSAWTQGKGDALVISRSEYFGGETASARFSQVIAQSYIEAGLSDDTTLGGNLIYATQSNDGPYAASSTGFSTAEIFVQQRLVHTRRTVVSARLLYAADTGLTLYRANGTSAAVGQDSALAPSILVGHAFDDDGRRFAGAELGYRASLGGEPDRLEAGLTVGLKPTPRWLLMVKSINTVSLGGGDRAWSDYDAYRLEPAIVYITERDNAYELGLRADVGGRNIAEGVAVFFSAWRRF